MVQEYDGSRDYNKTGPKRIEHDIADGEIKDRDNSFSCRAMLIRYSEEKVSGSEVGEYPADCSLPH